MGGEAPGDVCDVVDALEKAVSAEIKGLGIAMRGRVRGEGHPKHAPDLIVLRMGLHFLQAQSLGARRETAS